MANLAKCRTIAVFKGAHYRCRALLWAVTRSSGVSIIWTTNNSKPRCPFLFDRNVSDDWCVRSEHRRGRAMSSSARIFFAGVGTTFATLAVGFGGGLMLAKTAVYDSPAQARANSPRPPVRMVLPTSAEPTLQVTAAVPTPALEPVQPTVQTSVEKPVVNEDRQREEGRKAERERELRAERRRSAERKAKRIAAAKARQLTEPQRPQPGTMAFGGDASRLQGLFEN